MQPAANSYSLPLYLLAITGIGAALVALSLTLYRRQRARRQAELQAEFDEPQLPRATIVDRSVHTADVLDISVPAVEDTWHSDQSLHDED